MSATASASSGQCGATRRGSRPCCCTAVRARAVRPATRGCSTRRRTASCSSTSGGAVWGGSWGVTLALAYAERFPHRVTELVLVAVTLTRPEDVHWLYHEAGRFFPAEWRQFRAGVPEDERDGDLVAAYDRLLNHHPDPEVRARAAKDWCAWEDAVVSLEDGWEPWERFADPDFRMTFARTCAHYFSAAAWLTEQPILDNAHALQGIPGVLVHGRFDIGGPPDVPYLLAERWPDAELHLVRAGHTSGDPMTQAMLEATARFAGAR